MDTNSLDNIMKRKSLPGSGGGKSFYGIVPFGMPLQRSERITPILSTRSQRKWRQHVPLLRPYTRNCLCVEILSSQPDELTTSTRGKLRECCVTRKIDDV